MSANGYAIIGPNGSGKTTLLRMLTGTYQPDGGSIGLAGSRQCDRSLQQSDPPWLYRAADVTGWTFLHEMRSFWLRFCDFVIK